jgi:hypothetical protein
MLIPFGPDDLTRLVVNGILENAEVPLTRL